MSISISCGNCNKKYSVKDDLAGKKIRCKECETLISIPKSKSVAANEDDPFAGMNLKSTGRAIDDDEGSEDYGSRKFGRKASSRKEKPKPKKRRVYRREEGMPSGVKLAVGAIAVLMFFNGLSLLFGLRACFTPIPGVRLTPDGYVVDIIIRFIIFCAPLIVRLFIEYRVISGLSEGRRQTRITATIMAVLMALILGALWSVFVSIPAPRGTDAELGKSILVLVFGGQLLCQLVVILGLNLGRSPDYLSE